MLAHNQNNCIRSWPSLSIGSQIFYVKGSPTSMVNEITRHYGEGLVWFSISLRAKAPSLIRFFNLSWGFLTKAKTNNCMASGWGKKNRKDEFCGGKVRKFLITSANKNNTVPRKRHRFFFFSYLASPYYFLEKVIFSNWYPGVPVFFY